MGLDSSKLKTFEPAKFAGDWYEIASGHPEKHQCQKYHFDYLPKEEKLKVITTCVDYQKHLQNQSQAVISGISPNQLVVEQSKPVEGVIRLGPVPGEYLAKFGKTKVDQFFTVVWTDYANWALVKVNGKKALLSRYAQVSSTDISILNTVAKEQKLFDLKGLNVDPLKATVV